MSADRWVRVPVEPTLGMAVAGGVALTDASKHDLEATTSELQACYRAMISAAPAAPAEASPEPQPLTIERVRDMIEGAWCAGYYDAGYTHDSAYAAKKAEECADQFLGPASGAQGTGAPHD
jgi:hypothetical protein